MSTQDFIQIFKAMSSVQQNFQEVKWKWFDVNLILFY